MPRHRYTHFAEVLGLKLKHVDLESGIIRIEQRNWRMDIDDPKSEKSRRVLRWARYSAITATGSQRRKSKIQKPEFLLRKITRRNPCGIRACEWRSRKPRRLEGCDFEGLGRTLASLCEYYMVSGGRRQLRSRRQRIAGHANTKITETYTLVQLKRQEELTRRITGTARQGSEENQKPQSS